MMLESNRVPWKRMGNEEDYSLEMVIGLEQALFMRGIAIRLYSIGMPYKAIGEILEVSLDSVREIIALDDPATTLKVIGESRKSEVHR